MGSCLGKLLKRDGADRGYERANRNAEDAFDSDSDTDAPLLDSGETETDADRDNRVTPRLEVDEYHDDESDDEGEAPHRPTNEDITPETLDALAKAAMQANSGSLFPDLDAPVPTNTPADGNLLDL